MMGCNSYVPHTHLKWDTEFMKTDSYNPFHKHIKNHLLNVTLALSKGEAVSAFVPEYLEPFQVSESKTPWIRTKIIPRLCLDLQDADHIQLWNYETISHGHICTWALWIYNAVIHEHADRQLSFASITKIQANIKKTILNACLHLSFFISLKCSLS